MDTMTQLPWGRPLTVADLELMPDDGHRYELLDGTLLVSPAPSPRHQLAIAQLHLLLHAAAVGSELRVLFAPLDVVFADDTVLEPDLLIARRGDFAARNLPVAPLLAVEVLSPSTRRIDKLLKHNRYAAGGVEHYWVVDPAEPSLTAWRLAADGTYTEVGHVVGAGRLRHDLARRSHRHPGPAGDGLAVTSRRAAGWLDSAGERTSSRPLRNVDDVLAQRRSVGRRAAVAGVDLQAAVEVVPAGIAEDLVLVRLTEDGVVAVVAAAAVVAGGRGRGRRRRHCRGRCRHRRTRRSRRDQVRR